MKKLSKYLLAVCIFGAFFCRPYTSFSQSVELKSNVNELATVFQCIDYFYTDINTFEDYIKKDKFLEYAIYNNNYYGTLKEFVLDKIDNGINVFAVIDVQGAMQIKEVFPEAISIFIMFPSFNELENRLRKRNTDSEEDIIKRLKIAKEEITYKDKYDYIVINNTVDKAVLDIKNIIDNEKKKINTD